MLGEAMLKLEAQSQGAPGDAAMGETWEAVEKALTEYVGEMATPRRDGFWK